MSRIQRSIVSERPIDEVWGFVHDTTKDALWQTTLVESRQVDAGPQSTIVQDELMLARVPVLETADEHTTP